jgi:CheY-like chemotaxis protein
MKDEDVGMEKQVIWIIDENPNQLATYTRQFRRIMPPTIEIRSLEPLPAKEDYIDLVLGDRQTGCIIIDQKLKDTGVANYFGIELAKFLRSINQKIPIYILTNYTSERDQFVGSEWSVEDIIAKGDMSDTSKKDILKARIIRHMNVFDEISKLGEERFAILLRKSMHTQLSEEEFAELNNLQIERTAVTLASELQQLEKLEQTVDKYKEALAKFRRANSEVEDDE